MPNARAYCKVLGAALGILLLAAGCPGEDDGSRLTLRFSFGGSFRDLELWTEVVRRFEAANPDIRVKAEYISGTVTNDFNQKLSLTLISNTAADVFWLDDEQAPSYNIRGYLEDLNPYIARDRAELRLDEFLPTTLEAYNYRGKQGGMPWCATSILLFYNKELFDREGIAYPNEDWTWDDFRLAARRLTKDNDGDGRLDQFGCNITFGFIQVEPVLWSYGGDVLNENRSAFALDTPEALAALNFIYDMRQKDHSVAWAGEVGDIAEEAQFLTGRVAMVLGGSYLTFILGSVKGGMDWGVAFVPKGPTGERFTRVTCEGLSINANIPPERKEAGWRFIKFVLSEDIQALIGRMGRNMPVRRSDVLRYYVNPDTPYEEEKALEAMEHGRLTPITPRYVELRTAMNREFDKLKIGRTTVEAAVQAMKPEVDDILRREIEKWGRKPSR
jgi:multiple sugar transport system substrate-binding protein